MADIDDEKAPSQVIPGPPSDADERPAPTEGGEKQQVADDEHRTSADKEHPDSF